jgi:hypothetical protein
MFNEHLRDHMVRVLNDPDSGLKFLVRSWLAGEPGIPAVSGLLETRLALADCLLKVTTQAQIQGGPVNFTYTTDVDWVASAVCSVKSCGETSAVYEFGEPLMLQAVLEVIPEVTGAPLQQLPLLRDLQLTDLLLPTLGAACAARVRASAVHVVRCVYRLQGNLLEHLIASALVTLADAPGLTTCDVFRAGFALVDWASCIPPGCVTGTQQHQRTVDEFVAFLEHGDCGTVVFPAPAVGPDLAVKLAPDVLLLAACKCYSRTVEQSIADQNERTTDPATLCYRNDGSGPQPQYRDAHQKLSTVISASFRVVRLVFTLPWPAGASPLEHVGRSL